MEVVQAIKELKELKTVVDRSFAITLNKISQALDTAIKALEKQESKPPVPFGFESYICPKCNDEVGRESYFEGRIEKAYCEECGQKIDWEDFE